MGYEEEPLAGYFGDGSVSFGVAENNTWQELTCCVPMNWGEREMTENDIWRVAIDWIRFHTAKRNSQEQFDTVWADNIAVDLVLDGPHEELWSLIQVIHSLDQSPRVQRRLSAGLIEDLLASSGESFIERFEQKATNDPSLASLLGGVWRSSMSEDVWTRLQGVWDRRGWMAFPNNPVSVGVQGTPTIPRAGRGLPNGVEQRHMSGFRPSRSMYLRNLGLRPRLI